MSHCLWFFNHAWSLFHFVIALNEVRLFENRLICTQIFAIQALHSGRQMQEKKSTSFTHLKQYDNTKNPSNFDKRIRTLKKLDQRAKCRGDRYPSIACTMCHEYAHINKRWPMPESWSWLNSLYHHSHYSRASAGNTMPWPASNFVL